MLAPLARAELVDLRSQDFLTIMIKRDRRGRFVSGESVAELRKHITAQLNRLWDKISNLERVQSELLERVATLESDLDYIVLEM